MLKKKIANIVNLQSAFNSNVNPQWAQAEYKWSTAILVEATELISSFSWKWWKAEKDDIANAKMEVVDILHFVISECLVTLGDNPSGRNQLTNFLVDHLDCAHGDATYDNFECASAQYIELVKHFIGYYMGVSGYGGTVNSYSAPALVRAYCNFLVKPLFSSTDELLNLYLAKNVLNKLRQAHGYRTGEYIKMWGTKEDNTVVMELLEQNLEVSFTELYAMVKYPRPRGSGRNG